MLLVGASDHGLSTITQGLVVARLDHAPFEIEQAYGTLTLELADERSG